MHCLPISVVEKRANYRKEGYLQDVLKNNISTEDGIVCLDSKNFNRIQLEYVGTSTEHQLPSAVTMAKNLSQAAKEEAKAIIQGKESVPEDEVARRLAICKGCEFYSPNIPELSEQQQKNHRCVKCGCYMKFKAKLRSQSCPIKKW